MTKQMWLSNSVKGMILCAAVASGGAPAVHAAGFTPLGDLTGGEFKSFATAISADGRVVVGQSFSGTFGNQFEAFRWSAETGMVGLGYLPGGNLHSIAQGVSADGSVVVGLSTTENTDHAEEVFRWTAETGMVSLIESDVITQSEPDVSDDGSVIVGFTQSDSFTTTAFRWTQASGAQPIPGVDEAWGISGDGRAVVGQANNEAIRWTQRAGTTPLQVLSGGGR